MIRLPAVKSCPRLASDVEGSRSCGELIDFLLRSISSVLYSLYSAEFKFDDKRRGH